MKKLLPHEGIIGKRQGDTAWCEVCRMAEVPSGGVFGTPWQVFGTLGPTRKKQMALGIIPRAICG